MDSSTLGRGKGLTVAVGLCFFLSGAAGLAYEIVWMRMLGLVFGHTVFAITTVLAAFMAGLALGASLFGSLIDRRGRPLGVYGLLEVAIGLYALVIPFLLAQAQAVYVWLYGALRLSFFSFSVVQFVLVFLILLVPTTLMGATLPVLSKFFVERLEGVGRKVGDLYALNTFGAVLGSAAAGFVLLPAIGIQATTLLAAAVNIGIGAWAVMADRLMSKPHKAPLPLRSPGATRDVGPPVDAPRSVVAWMVLVGIGLSGAAAMVYEIAWTRALRLVIGSSTYAFSAMLTTFLVGLALGSFLFARIWGKRRGDAALFGWLEVAVGLTALGLVPAFDRMPDLVLGIFKHMSPSTSGALLAQFALSFLVMIVPTTILGAAFPCAVQVWARALPRLGRDVGQVYSVNTVGTIVGTLVAGFVLVPWLGAQQSMIMAAGVNMTVGATVLVTSAPPRPVWRRAAILPLFLLIMTAVLFIPRWDRRVMVGGVSVYGHFLIAVVDPAARFREGVAARELLFYREGINSTVSVERTARKTVLKVDGKVDASNGSDMATQLMSGHLPMLLHPRPERVLIIGLGSGVTAGATAQHPVVREIDVVELEPAVVEASKFFVRENRNVLRDPRVRLVIGDGRNFLLASKERYDVISSEPSNPWIAGVANLFSLEYYRLVRERLADDGIIVQWVQGYSLFPREMKMIVNTFRQVFPHATLWRTLGGDYLLIGTPSPLALDYALLKQRIAASTTVQQDMARLWFRSPLDVLTLFYLDEAALARFADGASVNTDDRPLLEFAAPLALYADTTDENSRLLREARTAMFPLLTNLPRGVVEARRLHFARMYWARGETDDALEQLRKAPLRNPEDTASKLERAKLLFALGEVEEATEELARLARDRPHDGLITSYVKAAAVLRKAKDGVDVAQRSWTRFGEPNPAEAHNNLGIFYTELGIRFGEPAFFDLAVDALETALLIEPEAYAVLNNLGNAYFELGKMEEAGRAYQRAIELNPRLAQTHFNLGLVYEKQGGVDLAAREFEVAAALRPDWELPRTRLLHLRGAGAADGEGALGRTRPAH